MTGPSRPRPAMRTYRALVRGVVLASALTLAGCVQRPAPAAPAVVPVPDPVQEHWASTLREVRAALAEGRGQRADSMLTAFRAQYGAAAQSAEALYWRALARLDNAEPGVASRAALADLDAYRASTAAEHRVEALTLRRTLAQLDSLRALQVVPDRQQPVTHPALVSRDSLRVRDEELLRVRADAAALQAELDRVRRRLAAPGRRP